MKIFPDMGKNQIDEQERQLRWRGLRHVPGSTNRLLPRSIRHQFPQCRSHSETVEKFEEDLTDNARSHGDLKVIIEIGEAIKVSPQRERGTPNGDPLMTAIREQLTQMLSKLQTESRMYKS
ncbi:MAG: hypothetical protein R3C03_16290 [Pirellulaceae bacterium]